jgi:hypothetical protein
VELFNYIFKLGVVFAIFGFLWGIIQLGYMLLRAGREKFEGEDYFVKIVKYFFLGEVMIVFATNVENASFDHLVTTTILLLMYYIGKLQKEQNKIAMFQMGVNGMPNPEKKFNLKAEIMVVVVAIATFIGFSFFPQYTDNSISNWFYKSILSIEKTAIFGAIFKLIGFIIIVNMFFKMMNVLSDLLTGKPLIKKRNPFNNNQKDDTKDDSTKFDDFEVLD